MGLVGLLFSLVYAAGSVATYSDSGYTNPASSFYRGATVYSKLTGGLASKTYYAEYWGAGSSPTMQSRSSALTTNSSGVATHSYTLPVTAPPGNWDVRFLSNPLYANPRRAVLDSPTQGNFLMNDTVTYKFHLEDRDGAVITIDKSADLKVTLKVGTSTIWRAQNPSSANGWTFNSADGTYTKIYTRSGATKSATAVFTVSGASTSAETGDAYFMGATPYLVTNQIFGATNAYPYKLVIAKPSYEVTSGTVLVQFKLYDYTYTTEITSASGITWMVQAKEANDYDGSGNQTTVTGTTPTYNATSGYWESTFSLPSDGKYRFDIQAIRTNAPEDTVIVNYAAKADFTVLDGTLVGGTISSNTTWTLDGSPYVVNSNVYVNAGVTLTIEPGVIIKFKPSTQISVSGTLNADGTSTNNIYLTSFKDDSIGGDTNNDGSASSPAKGDWYYIAFSSSSANSIIDSATIRYGGASTGSIYINSSSPSISDSLIENSAQAGVYVTGTSQAAIAGNTIFNNRDGIYAHSGASPSISGNTIRDNLELSSSSGIYLDNASSPTISGNAITNNNYGVYATGSSTGMLTSNTISNNLKYPVVMANDSMLTLLGNVANGNLYNAILLAGTRYTNVTIPRQELVYAVDGFRIAAAGTTVAVEPGTIFKFQGQYSAMIVDGTLLAQGTPSEQIIFTSMKDDFYGGDTNGDGSATQPAPGDWYQISLGNTSVGSQLQYVRVRYGGVGSGGYYGYGALYISNSSPTISDSVFEKNDYSGILVYGALSSPTISNSVFVENGNGISLTSGAPGLIKGNIIKENRNAGVYTLQSDVQIESNTISNNTNYGVFNMANPGWPVPTVHYNNIYGNGQYGLYNWSGPPSINAEYNWWGAASNPSSKIYGLVDYDPWALSPFEFEYANLPPAEQPSHSYGWDNYAGFEGDGINTSLGAYTYDHEDLKISGRGLPTLIHRVYNSKDSYNGPFGYGWTYNYNVNLRFNSDNSITVMREDGRRDTFTKNADGSYTPQKGVYDTLTKNADGTYTLKRKEQTKYNFNSGGRLISLVDKNGNQTTLSYNANNDLVMITDSAGRVLTLTYDTSRRVTKITDPANRMLNYAYDANGDLVSFTDSRGGITTYAYSNHKITSITNPRGYTFIQNTYDSKDRVFTQKDALNNTTAISYDEASRLTTITDPRGNTTKHYYDSEYKLTKDTDALNNSITYTYDVNGNVETTTDRRGYLTRYTYDSRGNVLSERDPLNNLTSYTYDSNNNLLTKTDPLNNTTTNTYDANSNLLTTTDALNKTTSMTYDAYGQMLTRTDANNKTTTFGYDSYGNLTSVADSLNNTTTYTYDIVGRKTSATDPKLHTTSNTYDANDNLIKVTDAKGNITEYTYDANDNLTSVKDAKLNVTSYTYNAMDKLIKTTDPLLNTTQYTYDGNYNKITMTDAKGNITNYAYDAVNRLTTTTYPTGSSVSYTYDANGNRISMTDSTGINTYTYDSRNLQTQVSYPGGKTISYAYDAVGRKTSMTLSGTGTTTYSYDAVNRMTSLTDPAGAVTSYQYDNVGNRIKMTYPNGSVTNYVYDAANRLTLLENLTSTGSVISRYAYEYDTDSNKTKVTEADGNTIAYAYDELHRLISEVKKDSGNVTIYSFSYTYDPVGNRLSKTDKDGNVTNYTYDAANRIQSAGSTTYGFDANGNLISKTTASGATSYNYDYEDRLTQITHPNATTTSMAYDGDDRRVSTTNTSGTTTKFVFDGGNVIQETDGAGLLITNYAVEPQELMGNIVSRKDAGGANSYYHYSALANDAGNVTALTDSAQATVASYTYEAFGNMVASTGSATNAYKFSTKNLDGESGLYYFGARYYDSEVGRFITKDPISGSIDNPQSLNPYIYCENNPLNLIDPDGQVVIAVPLAPVLLVTGATLITTVTIETYDPGATGQALQAVWEKMSSTAVHNYLQARNWVMAKKARVPKPPGYGRGWTKRGQEWVGPKGERWRYHPRDTAHGEHWDVRIPKGKYKGKWRYNLRTGKWQKK